MTVPVLGCSLPSLITPGSQLSVRSHSRRQFVLNIRSSGKLVAMTDSTRHPGHVLRHVRLAALISTANGDERAGYWDRRVSAPQRPYTSHAGSVDI